MRIGEQRRMVSMLFDSDEKTVLLPYGATVTVVGTGGPDHSLLVVEFEGEEFEGEEFEVLHRMLD